MAHICNNCDSADVVEVLPKKKATGTLTVPMVVRQSFTLVSQEDWAALNKKVALISLQLVEIQRKISYMRPHIDPTDDW